MMSRPARIAVVGSINMDLVVRCDHLPRPGETVLSRSLAEVCGGKGANQAVAASRAGGNVIMIGRVGDDAFAGALLANLRQEQVMSEAVRSTPECSSGLAVVAVEQSGQNAIMVVPGANARLSATDIEASRSLIAESDVLLVQLEVPLETVMAAIRIAREAGVRIILDPAPAPDDYPPELLDVDLICPNEAEAAKIVGQFESAVTDWELIAGELSQRGAQHAVITRGAHGALLWHGGRAEQIETFTVNAVDTTAAGDAFAGALAVFWSECGNLEQALRMASAAGALAASRPGAQPSLPTRSEIQKLGSSLS